MKLRLPAMYSLFCSSLRGLRISKHYPSLHRTTAAFSSTWKVPQFSLPIHGENTEGSDDDDSSAVKTPPWNDPNLPERVESKRTLRARQHVNPLATQFQLPTLLTPEWPSDVFDDLSRPLFLDIGSARGGFLLQMAAQNPNAYNYLGLEIRPIVVRQSQMRVKKHKLEGILSFVGCNANVDLGRLLTLAEAKGKLEMVTIQFPDPHFKARHAKRRVVTPELVSTLAAFMPPGSKVFLQSDVQVVLDEMRLHFRQQSKYFKDDIPSIDDYLESNILGVPTEREISVVERNLPVFRSAFARTAEEYTGLES